MGKGKRTELKLFRIRHDLSQEQIAEKLGFSRAHYAKFENGVQDTTLRFLEALQNAFGMTIAEAVKLAERDNENTEV